MFTAPSQLLERHLTQLNNKSTLVLNIEHDTFADELVNDVVEQILNDDEEELEEILEHTNTSGIMTRPAWELLHNLEIYKDCQKSPLPISESLSKRIINIPSSAFLARDKSNL